MNEAEKFEDIVREHYEGLFRFAMSLTRAEADAQDLTQQAFCIWAAKGHQLRDSSKAKTWLFTTLHRAFLETRRRQSRYSQFTLDEIEEELPVHCPEVVNQADASEVLAALAKVDEVYRAAVALFYLDDCPYKEIAEILEVPVGTVKSRIARGIAQLREILLSDESRAQFSRREEIPSASGTQESAADKGHRSPLSFRCARPWEEVPEGNCPDWDLGSTLLPKALGAL